MGINKMSYNNGSTILLREEDIIEEFAEHRINQHTLQPILNCELKIFSPPKNKVDLTDIRDYSFKNK
jgi:hypothetical protein